MSSSEIFEREKRAFIAVLEAVKELMANGYEVRMYDNVPATEMEALFVGPAGDGERSDVRKMRIPYEYLSLILAKYPDLAAQFTVLHEQSAQINKAMYALLKDALIRNLEDIGNGRDDSGGQKEYQA